MRNAFLFEMQKLAKVFETEFCPALDFGGSGNVGEESEQSDGENGGKVMGLSAWGAGIGNCLNALNEKGKGIVGKHENLRVKREWVRMYYVGEVPLFGKKLPRRTKMSKFRNHRRTCKRTALSC